MAKQEEKRYFPIFLCLEGKKILIVGAGKIAARRAKALLSFGAELWVVAPEFCAGMERLDRLPGRLHCLRRKYQEEDLQGMDLVLAATDDASLNHEIAERCREKKIPVNNASCQADCDFFFPALLQEEGLTIGVCSGGNDHKKVARVCEKLRRFFGTAAGQEG